MSRLAGTVVLFVSFAFAADPAHDFGRRLSAALAPQDTVALDVRGISPDIPAGELASLRSALEDELRPRLGAAAPNAILNVTVAQNQEGFVWVAEIRHGEERKTLIGSHPRPDVTEQQDPEALFSIEKKFVWEQREPVLDLAIQNGTLAVLEPARVQLYQRKDGRWQIAQALDLPDGWFAPRDPRGRLDLKGGALDITLPGLHCSADIAVPKIDCQPAETAFAKGRNFFTTPLPSFSFATLDGGDVLMAGLDGAVHFGDRALPGWGSDFVMLSTSCGKGRQVLATAATDAAEPDAVQAYAIVEHQAVPVSAPLELPGPVTALWPAPDGAALAVVRNWKTGRYAAFSLSVSCPR